MIETTKLTKLEAEAHAKVAEHNKPPWFCPLIKASCNPECICYVKAQVREDIRTGYYDVVTPYCNNYMFFGQ